MSSACVPAEAKYSLFVRFCRVCLLLYLRKPPISPQIMDSMPPDCVSSEGGLDKSFLVYINFLDFLELRIYDVVETST